MDSSKVTESALRLSWTERLELAQRLLESLRRPDQAQPTALTPELTAQETKPESRSIQIESISISFRKLRDALESSLE